MQENKDELTSKIKKIASNVDDYMIFIKIHGTRINVQFSSVQSFSCV